MEESRTLHVIESLYYGIDPITGEEFPASSPFQHPVIVRALGHARDALQRQQNAAEKRARQPANSGRLWNLEEEKQLAEGFERGTSVEELARSHQRSRYAVEARLVKLGKLAETSFTPKLAAGRAQ